MIHDAESLPKPLLLPVMAARSAADIESVPKDIKYASFINFSIAQWSYSMNVPHDIGENDRTIKGSPKTPYHGM
jgi:hypothetical protein